MKKIVGTLSYVGSFYKGFERQKGEMTIQGKLEEVLSILMDKEIRIKAAGRTDAGVNALGQVFAFVSDRNLDLESFRSHANRLLPPSIGITSLKEAPMSFDPRHSAKKKRYVYRFYFGEKDPFKNDTYAHLREDNFDKEVFFKALELFKGEHDFSNFTSKPSDKDNFIRNIDTLDILYAEDTKQGGILLESNGFMTYQIRFMVGEAISTARGKHTLEELKEMLIGKPRKIVSAKAPAEGLTLLEVIY
ncbi:MAG: tRNA pseudouridine(38-40) synthase TruA [Bacilli bacterium]|nr:tRNA pseudouridine(38-40) synthase TruA [Bacilli bacterium]